MFTKSMIYGNYVNSNNGSDIKLREKKTVQRQDDPSIDKEQNRSGVDKMKGVERRVKMMFERIEIIIIR